MHIFLIFNFRNFKNGVLVFSKKIIKVTRYCIKIRKPTILIPIKKAVKKYVSDVKSKKFPNKKEMY